MPRLSPVTLPLIRPQVATPGYDRDAVRTGVLHFGPGAFHRAHQAWYFDEMLHRDLGFGICAVSLRSADLRDALAPQGGLYTLMERETEPSFRVIGAIGEVLVAPEDPEAVFARFGSPDLRVVTATVTEKGYCLNTAGELDLGHTDIRADLAQPRAPRSFIGYLAEGLRRRKAAGLPAPVVISCDNLSGNGAKLGAAMARYAEAIGEPGLADGVAFPDSMVDSITPATDDELRARTAAELGLEDAWPVQRERFVQWVVEDRLGAHAEAFAAAGVTLASAVAPFERAKLRLLNGAHSTLAYVGLGLGHATVAEAMADARLAAFVERMMREDVAPSVRAPELDVPAYIADVLARFRNPAIVHRLSQIAWDGSQKLRFRLLETAGEALAAGRSVERLAVGVAAWLRFVEARVAAREPIVDPLAERLTALAGQPEALLAMAEVFPSDLVADPRFRGPVLAAYGALATSSHSVLK